MSVEPPEGVAYRRGGGVGFAPIKGLFPRFDVLIENMRPGKVAVLALGVETCLQIIPQLFYTAVAGFGSGVPPADRPPDDMVGQSFGGIESMVNDRDQPRLTGTCMGALINGVSTTIGVLAALLVGARPGAARRAGRNVTDGVRLLADDRIDATTQVFETGESPRCAARHPGAQPVCLGTGSGEAIKLHQSPFQEFWATWSREIDQENLRDDPCFSRYIDRADRANYKALDKEPGGFPMVRPPWRFDGQRPVREQAAAQVGEHTLVVLCGIRSEGELEALRANGAVVLHQT